MYRRIGIIIIILISFNMGRAQQDSSLLDLLGEEKAPTEYVDATFKGTRIINSQSIENVYKGVLDFRIAHRSDL